MELDASVSGKRKRPVRRSLEYPCVSRLRHRRLLAYLWRRNFDSTFDALVLETDVLFRVSHLQDIVKLGLWSEAIDYVYGFVPSVNDALGDEGRVLVSFLHLHKALDSIAAGKQYGTLVAEEYEDCLREDSGSGPGNIKIARMLLAMLHSDQLRASIDWRLVRIKAAKIAKDLVFKTPEFRDLLWLPTCPAKPHNILPIVSSYRRRRHVKKEGRIPSSDLAKYYLQKKRRMPSLSHCEGIPSASGISWKASAWLADLIDESVQAGICRAPCVGHTFEYSRNEGALGAPGSQSVFGNLTNPVISATSSKTNAGLKRPTIIGGVGLQGFLPTSNPKRSHAETTVCEEFDPKRQQISGELGHHAGSIFQAHYSLGDALESNMKSLSGGSGDCSSPIEIMSS